jgi:Flp pilus assembly protein TadB
MMFSNTASESVHLSQTQEISRDTGKLMSRKIWLPKLLYNALPYFYFVSGVTALLATIYISNWYWILPHYLLFAAACLHMGLLVYRRRRRRRT